MSDYDRSSTTIVREATGGGGLYFIVGVLVVAVLVGAYILMGTPGLHTQVAKAPAGQGIDVTVEQSGTPAPATPDSAGPAPSRQATPR
jgi:hypothetical protein